MRAARFRVHGDLLREALGMPPDSRFIGTSMDTEVDQVEFVVLDDDLPEANEPHLVDPSTRVHYNDEGSVVRVEWSWNVQASEAGL